MPLRDFLLPEFDEEMAGTRRVLERVPDGRTDWKPHAKSMPLGRIATHLAELPEWAANALTLDELDIMPAGGTWVPLVLARTAENLALFDANVVKAREALQKANDADLDRPWSLKMGSRILLTMPRRDVYRRMAINHMVHHRAQLGVYLRMNDVPLPATYGPSADERGM